TSALNAQADTAVASMPLAEPVAIGGMGGVMLQSAPISIPDNPEPGIIASGTVDGIEWRVFRDENEKIRLQFSAAGGTGIPAFAHSDNTPWADYRSSIEVVEVQSGIYSIGGYACADLTNAEEVTIPNGVTVQEYAFYNTPAADGIANPPTSDNIILGEGTLGNVTWKVENVNGHQKLVIDPIPGTDGRMFYPGQTPYQQTLFNPPWKPFAASIDEIAIADGVTEIADSAFDTLAGVASLVIPDSVRVIKHRAFRYMYALKNITLSQNLTLVEGTETFRGTAISSIDLPDTLGPTAWSSTFANCPNLEHVHLPASGTSLYNVFSYSHKLKDFNIPRDTKNLEYPLFQTPVQTVHFDVSGQLTKLVMEANSHASYVENRVLVLGDSVGHVPRGFVQGLCGGANNFAFRFKGPNTFTMDSLEGLSRLPSPLNILPAGSYYADASGVLYRVHSDHAELVSVPQADGQGQPITTYTVPSSISLDATTQLPVTAVGSHAISMAGNLASLTFANPAGITSVAQEAFAGCPTLTRFNGQTTVAGAKQSLPNAATNIYTFERSGLGYGDIIQSQTVRVENGTILNIAVAAGGNRTPTTEQSGTFNYYTGESSAITIAISNPNNDATGYVHRVYMQFDDADGVLSYDLGEHTFVVNNHRYQVFLKKADAPFTYYWEIPTPQHGDTLTITYTASYPSPSSDGGKLVLTGNVLTPQESDASGTAYLEPGVAPNGQQNFIELDWATRPDRFPVVKSSSSEARWAGMENDPDGPRLYATGISFAIDAPRSGNTLEGMGKDHVQVAEFRDTFTIGNPGEFGDAITWNDEVRRVIETKAYRTKFPGSSTEVYYNRTNEAGVSEDVSILKFDKRVDNLDLAIDPNDPSKLTLYWRKLNTTPTEEMPSLKNLITLGSRVLVVEKPEYFDRRPTVHNAIELTNYYQHSAPHTTSAQASVQLNTVAPSLSFSKSITGTADKRYGVDYAVSDYLGSPTPFKLRLVNQGSVPYRDSNLVLEDTLSPSTAKDLYLSPEGIARMFAETHAGEKLTIRIAPATLANQNAGGVAQQVATVDGQQAQTDVNTSSGDITQYFGRYTEGNAKMQTSDTTVIANDATITFRNYEGSSILGHVVMDVAYGGSERSYVIGAAGDYASVRQALDGIGHLVVPATAYTVRWEMPGSFTIYGGESIVRIVHSSRKDSFMLMQYDQEEEYNKGQSRLAKPENNATADADNIATPFSYSASASEGKRDFRFDKDSDIDAAMNSIVELGTSGVGDGRVVGYELSFSHDGHSRHEVLPLVDHMQNSQALLVPVEDNPELSGTGLKIIGIDGVRYYLLEKKNNADEVDVYRNVRVGVDENESLLVADRIEVRADPADGFSTVIKWYYKDVGDEKDGTAETHRVQIMSYVTYNWDRDQDGTIRLRNDGWLNDHEGRRLWEHVGPEYSRYAINKEVQNDSGEWVKYSVLHKGEEVKYRLTVHNSTNDTNTLVLGSFLKDYLPSSIAQHPWTVADITVDYDGHLASPGSSQPSFTVATPDPEKPLQQVLQWNDDVFFALNPGPNYLYVTLKMPADNSEWDAYEQSYATSSLFNDFEAFGQTSQVSHNVAADLKPLLQKGVERVYRKKMMGTYNNSAPLYYDETEDGIHHYANDDSWERGVLYDITLFNGGEGKLFLNDIQDHLPKGFTLAGVGRPSLYNNRYYYPYMAQNVYSGNKRTTVVPADGRSVVYKGIHIEQTTQTNGAYQNVAFSVSQLTSGGSPTSDSIRYDEAVGKCYLEPGEAISFSYFVRTNDMKNTLPIANNVVAMEYDGSISPDFEIADATITADAVPIGQRHNEGGCDTIDAAAAASAYGFSSQNPSATFLCSEVQLSRGSIDPGITKRAARATSQTGVVTENPLSAEPSDTITWEVAATNAGNLPIQDYTLTDTVQATHGFTGPVWLTIYQPDAVENPIVFTQRTSVNTAGPIITITNRTVEEDGRTRLTLSYVHRSESGSSGSSPKTADVYVNGSPVDLLVALYNPETANYVDSYVYRYISCPIQVGFTQDANGNETMSLRVMHGAASIPAYGGRAVLTLDTKERSSTYESRVMYNSTWITPNTQGFDPNVNQGNYTTRSVPLKGDDGKWIVQENAPSVRNSAPITVAFGTVTASVKSVRELGLPAGQENQAYSNLKNGLPDRITLTDKQSLFRYRLEVDNTNNTELRNLVLIDNLPERNDWHTFVWDSARLSAFNVSLAANPDFRVYYSTLSEPEHNVRELDPSSYIVEFLDVNHTVENDPLRPTSPYTVEDWRGTSAWSSTFSDATRSVRVRLKDGVTVPANTTLNVEFTCKINDANVAPGSIAWNSFGYNYLVRDASGQDQELSATPMDVGIRVPGIPSIAKRLQDRRGMDMPAERSETFDFLVFEGGVDGLTLADGSALSGRFSTAELADALARAGRRATLISTSVDADQYLSNPVSLENAKTCSFEGASGWAINEGEDFSFVHGQSYTAVELDRNVADDTWHFGYLGKAGSLNSGRFYTFDYDRRQMQEIVGTNLYDDWDISLTKTGERLGSDDRDLLAGAVFGLYSSDVRDAMSDQEYARERSRHGLSAAYADVRLLKRDGATYYLCALASSGGDGVVAFIGLRRDAYQLVELKVPVGYADLNGPMEFRKAIDPNRPAVDPATNTANYYVMNADAHIASATALNHLAFELPETGGPGVLAPLLAGLTLLIATFVFLRRRRFIP
ncbi:MAG TPA: hypothetical protein DCP91_03260, partial [Eggerthellaceae bacterium]|nr:hypothetical protein [Eggerthellaceae bacterium]